MSPLTPLFCLAGVALGASNELRIHNASEFITFSKTSSDYTGTTVYLESDLDFSGGLSEQFEPIGNNNSFPFSGIFDGQGHTISNLVVNSSSSYVGLFGYSTGSIKNVVVGSSCSVASNFTGDNNARVGGIIGYHYPTSSRSSISNLVNMGDVVFEGNATGLSGFLYLGGIIGQLYFSKTLTSFVKNSVNYGALKHFGMISESVYIGGIVGESSGSSSLSLYIQNCLNYGTITATGTAKRLYAGGIIGQTKYTVLKNCVSAGLISSISGNKGSIVGKNGPVLNIEHCLWTSDVGCDVANGTGTPSITSSSLASINPITVNDLNEYASNNGWNKWLLNTDNKSVTFKVNNNKGFSYPSNLILLPGIGAESGSGLEFSGWYSDPYCNEPFTTTEIIEDTSLYGLYGKVISVSFDPNGGAVIPSSKRVAVNGTYGTLPTPNRTGYSFLRWFTEGNEGVTSETIVSIPSNHTLIAQWTLNNYTVTFNVNGGGELKDPTKVVTFNDIYGTLPIPNRTGYRFLGWFTENNESVTSESVVSIPRNHTLIAQWEEIPPPTIDSSSSKVDSSTVEIESSSAQPVAPTSKVEIVLGVKSLSEEEAREIIERYTNEDFEIVGFEKKGDEVRVIIKFADKETAENFVETIKASSDVSKDVIKGLNFIHGEIGSFSPMFCPIFVSFFLI